MKKLVNNNQGLTLIELLVAIAVLAILGSMLVVSWTSTLEEQRQKADLTLMESIDLTFKQIYTHNDAFDEAKPQVHDSNKLTVTFPLTNDDGVAKIQMSKALMNGQPMSENFPIAYNYLLEYIDEDIVLASSTLKYGYYQVVIEFNLAKWENSSIRQPTISNDSIQTTNSGKTYLRQYN